MKTIVFDTETTGIPRHPSAKKDVQPRIIEFAGVLADPRGVVIEELEFLVDPEYVAAKDDGKLLDWNGITRITGLTKEDIEGKPRFVELVPALREFFAKADRVIAHNLPFDRTMMLLELERTGTAEGFPWPAENICTVQELAEEFGYRPKLIQAYERYTGNVYKQTHRAMDDVKALLELCTKIGVLK